MFGDHFIACDLQDRYLPNPSLLLKAFRFCIGEAAVGSELDEEECLAQLPVSGLSSC